MPLDKYTAIAMEGLKRGDLNIVTPDLEELWNNHEKGRIEKAEQIAKQMRAPNVALLLETK